jgi:hypothetical protein
VKAGLRRPRGASFQRLRALFNLGQGHNPSALAALSREVKVCFVMVKGVWRQTDFLPE